MTSIENAPPKNKKRVRGDAIQRFAKACSRALRDNGDEIAQGLFRRAVEGNAGAARLLLKILEKHPTTRSHKKRTVPEKQPPAQSLARLQLVPRPRTKG